MLGGALGAGARRLAAMIGSFALLCVGVTAMRVPA